ncbi:MAG: hypothetical protein R3C20_04755 [Planctomycetaceae bacterium]
MSFRLPHGLPPRLCGVFVEQTQKSRESDEFAGDDLFVAGCDARSESMALLPLHVRDIQNVAHPANLRQSISVIAFSLLLTHLSPATCLADQSSQSRPGPNIVVIYMDDMGYADIGPFGATDYQTQS